MSGRPEMPETYAWATGWYERATSTQLLAFPGFRSWWRQLRSSFSPSFVGRIDALIAATTETDTGVFLREWQQIAQGSEPAA
jgi:hypothetical protein